VVGVRVGGVPGMGTGCGVAAGWGAGPVCLGEARAAAGFGGPGVEGKGPPHGRAPLWGVGVAFRGGWEAGCREGSPPVVGPSGGLGFRAFGTF